MRSFELTALRRLFPLAESVADEGKADKYRVVFRPSDPDWVSSVTVVINTIRNLIFMLLLRQMIFPARRNLLIIKLL